LVSITSKKTPFGRNNIMTIVAIEDHRNVEWVTNNKGSMLLQKMGWNHGEGIGKRTTNQTTTALRALKRKELLGLGASIPTEGGNSESTGNFASVLKHLQAVHGTSTKSSKGSKKKSKSRSDSSSLSSSTTTTTATATTTLTLAQNRCNAGRKKIRESKFVQMSAEDMAAVFGNRDFKAVGSMDQKESDVVGAEEKSTSATTTSSSMTDTKKRKGKNETKNKKDKKKKRRKSSDGTTEASSSS
jgi:hypothetical protein